MEVDIALKRKIFSSIFPEKMVFENHTFRTIRLNEAIRLIYKINSKLRGHKNIKREDFSSLSVLVLETELTTNQLLKDMRKITDLPSIDDNPTILNSNQIDAIDTDYIKC